MIRCKLLCGSNSSHLSQVYTGFALLNQAREILLSQQCETQTNFIPTKPAHLMDARRSHLRVIVNDNLRLYYDCHDSHEIDEQAAQNVNYYFKRGYRPAAIAEQFKSKVFPLGLNYAVYTAEFDVFEQERQAAFATTKTQQQMFLPTVENTRSAPDHLIEPKALFITRVWEPFHDRDRASARERMNEMRVKCIERLRQEFGNRFLGGLLHTRYAIANYKQALLTEDGISAKENYFKLLRLFPIGITTTGLHGSTGWKMGEYVAFSRAIVSEKLHHQVPGDFGPDSHYLEFQTVDQCVEQVGRLFSDAALRSRLMKNNFGYYHRYLRPDVMIKRTLNIALGGD